MNDPAIGSRSARRWRMPALLVLAVAVGAAAGPLVFARFSSPGDPQSPAAAGASRASAETQSAVTYYCPMTPSYRSDRPGPCPICGMALKPLPRDMEASPIVQGRVTVTISPERRQLVGVRTDRVERKRVSKTTHAFGRVEFDEETLSTVNLKFAGWVEELFVKSEGERVRKGAPLLSLYSPEVLEAERNLLLAKESSASLGANAGGEARTMADDNLRFARERLRLWDLTDEQIAAVEAKGEPDTRLTILAKADGVVTRRDVRAGSAVEPGRDLFQIADLSTVWVDAEVYEYELQDVAVGQRATVRLSSRPGEPLEGRVVAIYPYLSEVTRTNRVRLAFPNPDGTLKPGMYAQVSLEADLGEQRVVDEAAVLFTGTRDIVFVDRGEGRLEPREVELGPRTDGGVVVRDGLGEGERVVVSGNFLVDSESRLKAALLQGASGSEHVHGQ
jgi:membrane fusion protein, copper/silver efflux system